MRCSLFVSSRAVVTFCIIGIGSVPATAGTWRVPARAPTIQAGIDSAVALDTVLVAPGTYRGTGNRDVVVSKDLVVRSETGAQATVLDVQATRSDPHFGFWVSQRGPATRVEGFTIQSAYARMMHVDGSGVLCLGSDAALRDLVILGCASPGNGGGIGLGVGGAPTVANCVIQGCSAAFSGGGISIADGANAVIESCVITGNIAYLGGGVFVNTQASLRDCVIAGNTTAFESGLGSGLMVAYPAGNVEVERTIVAGNCTSQTVAEIVVDTGNTLGLGCCIFDPTHIVALGSGTVVLTSPNVAEAPGFCAPLACSMAPMIGGDYHVHAGSPGLSDRSPCGRTIGFLGLGCAAPSRVAPMTWSGLKVRCR